MTLTAEQARNKDLSDHIRHLPDPDRLKIVLLDDDSAAKTLRDELGESGIAIQVFAEPVRAVAAAAHGAASLFILSCHLDPRDLQVVTEAIRHQLGVPVALACDRWDADLVGPAILAGARPILTLPYSSEDLIAAIETLPTRARPAPSLCAGDLVLNLAAHDVSVADQHVDLSPTEFNALHLLLIITDTTVARSAFASALWPNRVPPSTAITSVTRRLRRKLTAAGLPAALRTVRSLGYRLDSAGCARGAPSKDVTRSSTSSTILATS